MFAVQHQRFPRLDAGQTGHNVVPRQGFVQLFDPGAGLGAGVVHRIHPVLAGFGKGGGLFGLRHGAAGRHPVGVVAGGGLGQAFRRRARVPHRRAHQRQLVQPLRERRRHFGGQHRPHRVAHIVAAMDVQHLAGIVQRLSVVGDVEMPGGFVGLPMPQHIKGVAGVMLAESVNHGAPGPGGSAQRMQHNQRVAGALLDEVHIALAGGNGVGKVASHKHKSMASIHSGGDSKRSYCRQRRGPSSSVIRQNRKTPAGKRNANQAPAQCQFRTPALLRRRPAPERLGQTIARRLGGAASTAG